MRTGYQLLHLPLVSSLPQYSLLSLLLTSILVEASQLIRPDFLAIVHRWRQSRIILPVTSALHGFLQLPDIS
ncbi:hypothetical protein ACTXT7_006032 [Hymenolepis weldensis]